MENTPQQRLVFHGKQQVALEPFELDEPGPSQVKVRCLHSMMSTGTENIVYNRLFDEGTHWDNWVKYPFYPGYAFVGIVESVGSEVTTHKVGDTIVCRAGHASHALVDGNEAYPIPAGINLTLAPWYAIAKIAYHAAVAAKYALGDTVAIIGAGPIGQMSLRWARAAGAKRVFVIDPVKQREAMALKGGANAYFSVPANEAAEAIQEANEGKLPSVVIDSTGHPAVFSAALGLAAPKGRVILLGDTGTPAKQTLTADVILKGLTITGVHDPQQIPGWTPGDIAGLFYELVGDGRISLEGLNTHSFSPQDCVEAYTTANRDRAQTMGIIFNWSE